jgi:hypothetical protein
MAEFLPDSDGPWHIVSRTTGKHIGPFSTETDCLLAQRIATPDWSTGIVMNRREFDYHLTQPRIGSTAEAALKRIHDRRA